MSVSINATGPGLIAEYARNVRGVVRALWSGAIDYDQFYELLSSTVRNGLTRNWYAGAQEAGISPSDLSPQERQKLAEMIYSETSRIDGFASAILEGSKANGGKFADFSSRTNAWSMRAQDAQNTARMMADGDVKLKWVMDPQKEHCPSCAKLSDKVKRASYWQKLGVQPQSPPNPVLKCGGWLCGCSLQPTEEPCSKGPLPSLP